MCSRVKRIHLRHYIQIHNNHNLVLFLISLFVIAASFSDLASGQTAINLSVTFFVLSVAFFNINLFLVIIG